MPENCRSGTGPIRRVRWSVPGRAQAESSSASVVVFSWNDPAFSRVRAGRSGRTGRSAVARIVWPFPSAVTSTWASPPFSPERAGK